MQLNPRSTGRLRRLLLRTRSARLLAPLAQTWHLPLYRSSYALILTTVGNAAIGLLFWIAAARLYPTRVVGLGAGGISALQLFASVGWVGLQFTLMRYVPVAGFRSRRLVALVYAAGGSAALLGGVVFVFVFPGMFNVPYLSENAASRVAFCASVVVWVVFSLQDAVLIGIRRSLLIPLENSIYGLLKLVLLVGLASISEPWTLLGVWVAGAGVLVLAVNGLLFRRFLRTQSKPAALPTIGAVARFSTGHTGVALTAGVPDLLVPLLVLRYLGQTANAYYYAAWTIGFSARLLAVNMGNALTVEAAYAEVSVWRLLRSVTRLSVVVLAPVILILLLGAGAVLRIFGPDYANAGASLLRYFALSLAPFTVAAFVIALDRVRERFSAALAIASVGSATTIGLDLVLIPRMGITGAGVGWLVGQSAAAVVALATLTRFSRVERHFPSVPLEEPGETPVL